MRKGKLKIAILCTAAALFTAVMLPVGDISAKTEIGAVSYSYSAKQKTGVYKATYKKEQNVWCYLINGEVQYSYTGFAENEYGWWYIVNGKVDFSKNDILKGTVNGETGWWYVKGGKVQFVDTVAKNANGWWAVFDGMVNFNYTGIADNDYGSWYCKNGKVDFSYEGFGWGSELQYDEWWDEYYYEYYNMYCKNGKVDRSKTDIIKATVDGETGWWYVKNGKIEYTYTVAKNSLGWWCISYGKVDFGYTGVASNEYGDWFIRKGKVDFSANGIVKDDDGNKYYCRNGRSVKGPTVAYINGKWRYVDYNGRLDESYNGAAANENGMWYVQNGIVNFAGTGIKKMNDGNWYNFVNNRLVPETIAKNSMGYWLIDGNGMVCFEANGINYANGDAWFVTDGKIDVSKNGVIKYDDSYVVVDHGKLDSSRSLAKYKNDWLYFRDGYYDPDYTGVASNENGLWYVVNGKIDFDFTGMYGPNSVKNGKFTTNYTNSYESYADKYTRVFGKSDDIPWRGDAQYSSQAEADSHMTNITIKAWDFVSGTSGEKYTRTFTIEVNKAVAPSLQKAFDEIYALPEKFPIHAIGGNDGKYTSGQHGSGLAVDINPNENYEAYVYDDGSVNITCGSLYEPGKNPYSIATDGNVAKILIKYGFTQGVWGSKVDYMHWSYFGN